VTAAATATVAAATGRTTATVTAATAVATGAGTARSALASLVDVQCTALELMAIELLDRLLGFLVAAHFDEAETAGATGGTVHHHRGRLDRAGLGEQSPQVVIRGFEVEVSDEKLLSHVSCRSWPGEALFPS